MDASDQTTTAQAATDQVARDQPADQRLTTADLARGEAAPRTDGSTDRQGGESPPALFPAEDARNFQARWDTIQVSFVDEPRRAVEQADALVAEALKRQAEIFAAARADLEAQWEGGEDVSTEDLRQALRRYRAFFTRVLKV